MEVQERQVAHLVRLTDVMESPYVEQEGWTPDYVHMPWGQKVSRINIIGTIVDVSEQERVLDDGSAVISLRTFDEVPGFKELAIGDTILCIGKVREYANKRYIIAEIVRKIPVSHVGLRQDHIAAFDKVREKQTATSVDELDKIEQDIKEQSEEEHPLLALIEEKDKGEGVHMQELLDVGDGDVQRQIDTLLMNGDIFEIKPGVVKVLK